MFHDKCEKEEDVCLKDTSSTLTYRAFTITNHLKLNVTRIRTIGEEKAWKFLLYADIVSQCMHVQSAPQTCLKYVKVLPYSRLFADKHQIQPHSRSYRHSSSQRFLCDVDAGK